MSNLFGQQPSSGASSGSLFGTSSTSGNSGGNLFGGGGNTGFSFGGLGQNTSSGAGESKSIFGATTDNKPGGSLFAPQPTAGGQFGQSSQSGPASGLAPTFSFSQKKDDRGAGTASPSMFGTPRTSTPSLTSATPAAPQPTWSLPNASTTPAGPPPAPSMFGASTGGASNIFGGGNKPAQDNALTPTAFNFTNQPDNAASAYGPTPTPQPPAPSLFGGGANAHSFSSASKPSEKHAESSVAPPAAPTGQKSLFSFSPPATSQSPSTTASATPFFGAAPAKPASATGAPPFGATQSSSHPQATQSSSPSLFSQPAAAATSDSTQRTAFSFPPLSSQASAPSTPATTSEAPKPLFGAQGGTSSSAAPSKPLFGAAPAASTAPTPATIAAPPAPTTTSTAPNFSFGPSAVPAPQAPATTGASGLAASTTGPLPQAHSRLKNKTMDEILTRWATDLTKYSKEFKNNAETIAKWDQIIVDNSSKIDKLYVRTRTCEKQTMSVDMQLTAVENSQNELESWLTKYENDVDAMLSKEGATPSELGGPDQERERTYKLAEKLQERLDGMGQDLASMVDEVNAVNASLGKNGKADEPITQIVRVLNSHLSQLQAIDQGTAALQARVVEAQKAASGLGYLNGGPNGDGRAHVDDFYRSYMGRR